MDSKRLRLIIGASACAVLVYVVANLAMDGLARRMEVSQRAYLWWQEEWMQLFGPANFVDRGKHRILLSASSEGREGFLFDEFEAELQGSDVYNNSYSRHSLTALLLVLQYIEVAYGPSAIPRKIVVGATPEFVFNLPLIQNSYLPRVIDRYSSHVRVDLESSPPRLVPKSWLDSVAGRYFFLTHQSRRYRNALRAVRRAVIERVAPELAGSYWVRLQLVPSTYHHLPRRDQAAELKRAKRVGLAAPDPVASAESLRVEWAALERFVKDRNIDLYVVVLPQSTWWINAWYEETYDDYRRILRDVVGNTPFLDLADFLRDDEYYDMTHATLASAKRISQRVARFVRETDESRSHAGSGGVH